MLKCVEVGHYKKDCRSKNVEKEKGYEDTPSTEANNSSEEGGDVYLASMGNPSEHDTWLIDSGASCHMTPHREWFYEYEKYNGGDVYLGDDFPTSIVGCWRNLVSIENMDVVCVKTVCGDDGCQMV